jgi:O-antigen/teichoic acid export membrane protein
MKKETTNKPWQVDGRESVKKDISSRIKGLTTSKIFGFLRSFTLPVVLTPELFGIWSLITVLINYANLAHLGTLFEMNRRLPQLEARDNSSEYVETRSIAFWLGIFLSLSVSFFLLIYIYYDNSYTNGEKISFYLFLIPIVILQYVLNYQKINMRGLGKIKLLSKQEVLFSLLLLVLNVIGAYFFEINGLLLSTVITYAITVWYFRNHNVIDSIVFNTTKGLDLLKKGMPLLGVGLLAVVMGSIGQIMVANKLDLASVGYLSLGLLIGSIVYTIPTALAGVLNPRYLREYGKYSDPSKISMIFMKYLKTVSIISPIFIGLIMIIVDFIIFYFLNKYEPAIEVMQILLIGMSFQSLSLIFGDPLIAINKQKLIIYAQLISIVLLVSGMFILLEYEYGLKGVALTIMSVNFIYCLMLATIFIIHTLNNKNNWFKLLESILNISIILIVSIGLIYLFPLNHTSLSIGFIDLLYRVGLFLILISVFIYKKRLY